MSPESVTPKLSHSREDFISDQQVRWCPGCGDYAILATMQRTLSKFEIPREKYVFTRFMAARLQLPPV